VNAEPAPTQAAALANGRTAANDAAAESFRSAHESHAAPARATDSLDLSVIVPVYNSAATLETLAERLQRVCEGLDLSWEIVFVDDNSCDDSWQALLKLRERDPDRVTIVQLMRNFGQHNALMCGFHHARGRFVATLDDDLQNPPEEIPRLLEAIQSRGLDLVYGSIAGAKRHGVLRNLGSKLITRFGQFAFQTSVAGSSFRIIRRELVQSILTYQLSYTYIDGLLAWNSQRIGAVPVSHHERAAGASGYSFRRLAAHALNLLTNFSLIPLQVVSLLGIAAAAAGFALGLWFLLAHFLGWITVSGYASLIVTILILGGIQLLSLGVMGEYLGRIHLNINRRPQFVVRKAVCAAQSRCANDDQGPE